MPADPLGLTCIQPLFAEIKLAHLIWPAGMLSCCQELPRSSVLRTLGLLYCVLYAKTVLPSIASSLLKKLPGSVLPAVHVRPLSDVLRIRSASTANPLLSFCGNTISRTPVDS